MATPNLGQAIALGYKIPRDTFAVEEISRRRKEEQDAIDNARKAAQKSKELQDKYRDDLDKFNVEGIIAPLQRNSQAASAAITDHVKKGIAKNTNYNPFSDDDLDVLRFDLKQITARDRVSSEAYLKDVEKGVGNPKLFTLQTQWTDAVGGNDKEAWDKLTGGTGVYTYGAITPNEEIKKIEWDAEKSKDIDETRQGAITTAEGAVFVPEQNKKQRTDAYRMKPAYQAEMVDYMSKGMTAEKADAFVFEDYFSRVGQKAAPLKEDREDKDALTVADVKTQVPVNIIEGVTGKKIEDVAHYGLTLPTDVILNIPSTNKVIDRSTGKVLDYVGQLNISGGQILSTKITENGKTKYVPYLYTSTTITKPATAFVEAKTIKKDIEVRLSDIRGQRVIEKHKKAVDEIERLTEGLNKPEQKTSAGKAYTVKGKSYSKSDVKKAADASGMTIDEYIKEANK